ncbi:MAG TPA: ATP synthase F0 subunit C [Myxococcota bacterium]|jgi:F-type H+-transporting ATPase subunit c|nr:ATP synthase F0 subunit C [Myxococcota bacterium]
MGKFGKLALLAALAVLAPGTAFAQEAGAHVTNWGPALGAGLAFGLAALGCGLGQGLTASNTTAGIARNPGAAGAMNVPFILGMALIESIALVGFVTAFLLIGKV